MYTKVYASLITSSVWSEDPATCKVWVTLMAMADRGGIVFGSVSGLARICALPIPDVEAALRKFLAPDPYSSDLTRQPKNEGRRIEVVEGGWRLLNHAHYRDLPDADARREQVRQAAANFRNKKKAESNQPSSSVITSNQSNHASSRVSPSDAYTDADAEAGSEAGSKAGERDPSDLSGRPADDPDKPSPKSSADPEKRRRAEAIERVFAHYLTVWPKSSRYTLTPDRRAKIAARLKSFSEDELKEALTKSGTDDWPERPKYADIEKLLPNDGAVERWLNFTPKVQPVEKDPLDDGWMEWAAEQQRALHEPGPGESER